MMQQPDQEGRYRLTGREYEAILRMHAALSALMEIEPAIWERLGLVTMGKCDYRMIKHKLDRICYELLGTVPTKKLLQINREIKNVHVYTHIGKSADRHQDGVCYVPEEAFLRLLNEVVGMKCLWCEKKGREVKKCEFLTLLTDLLPYAPDPSQDPTDGSCQIAGRTSILEE